jgi:hypothetical protein
MIIRRIAMLLFIAFAAVILLVSCSAAKSNIPKEAWSLKYESATLVFESNPDEEFLNKHQIEKVVVGVNEYFTSISVDKKPHYELRIHLNDWGLKHVQTRTKRITRSSRETVLVLLNGNEICRALITDHINEPVLTIPISDISEAKRLIDLYK